MKFVIDMDNEAQAVASGDLEVGFEADDSSDVEEVQHELEVLKADTLYHDFLVDVALDRKIPDDPSDAEFVVDGSGDAPPDGKVDLKDLVVEADSSSSDESEVEEVAEDVEVKVPPTSLKEAAARYPPFWKVKDQIHRASSPDYKSDEDPDYIPDKSDCQKCISGSGSASAEGGDPMNQRKESCDHEVLGRGEESSSSSDSDADIDDDNDEDVANLVEMVEDLAVASNDVEFDEAEENEPQACLVKSIIEHDDENYKSDEDPDFVAPADVDNVSDDASSADDESSDAEEKMQE